MGKTIDRTGLGFLILLIIVAVLLLGQMAYDTLQVTIALDELKKISTAKDEIVVVLEAPGITRDRALFIRRTVIKLIEILNANDLPGKSALPIRVGFAKMFRILAKADGASFIVISKFYLSRLSPSTIEMVLSHELAHLQIDTQNPHSDQWFERCQKLYDLLNEYNKRTSDRKCSIETKVE